jgi:hypothetical protein
VSKPTEESLQGAWGFACADAAQHFAALGKSELVAVVNELQQFSVPSARWVIERNEARAAGDDAKLDALDRTFELLEADGVAVLVEAGVMAQSEAETFSGVVLKTLGRFVVAAAIAA